MSITAEKVAAEICLSKGDRPVDIHPAFWTQANEDAARVALELSERANSRVSANGR